MGTIFISICLMPASGSHFIWILGKREKSIRHKPFQTPKREFNFPFTSTLSFLLINFFEEWVCFSGQRRSSPAPPCLPPCVRVPPPTSVDLLCPYSDLAGIIPACNTVCRSYPGTRHLAKVFYPSANRIINVYSGRFPWAFSQFYTMNKVWLHSGCHSKIFQFIPLLFKRIKIIFHLVEITSWGF